ncbi:zinc-dependent alcohol dehydrogenase [Pseudonocardia charpentierae]|uniref:Alcohol dehydrogenase catalytic domain-containing protein n=1 Tax=Pseudonocardia charpentierae TaxID=3075545 RepID=A0ABU2NFV9_9PSEU|nr:alcohol dehydrogenase catalytic domain-containing protein [Pseudonocardia sp. DSM 45834]MDT0352636.1 alcohol dehydrogenase catalytic domain-containing protein [Pseudonocardia sp. DSM 45834]
MRALTWVGGSDVVVAEVPEPEPGPDQVLIAVGYTGLCGTDLHICAGEHPRAKPGVVIGHEIAGTVAATAHGFEAGTAVVVDPLVSCGRCATCRSGRPHTCENLRLIGIDFPGGAAPLVAVDADRLIPVPGSPDLRHLAFAEPLAVAVRAVRRSGMQLGQTVAVVGGGPIGVAVALCARNAGAGRVVLAEPAPARREFAAGLGLETVASAEGLAAEVVFDAAGHPAVAALVTDLVAPGGTVVVVAVYGDPAPVDLRAVTFKELTAVGTRVYSRGDLAVATDLVASGRFDPEPFLTSTVTLDEAAAAIADLRRGVGLKVLVRGDS